MPTRSVTRLQRRRSARNRWLRWGPTLGLLIGTGLACASNGQTARAQIMLVQADPGLGPAKPLTPEAIGKSCLAEHIKYCPNGKGGTRPDIACLQQHHTSLSLSCRNTLRQAAANKAADPINSSGLH